MFTIKLVGTITKCKTCVDKFFSAHRLCFKCQSGFCLTCETSSGDFYHCFKCKEGICNACSTKKGRICENGKEVYCPECCEADSVLATVKPDDVFDRLNPRKPNFTFNN